MPLRYACTSTPSSAARRDGIVGDEREREVRLGELLLGVVDEAGVAHVGLVFERGVGFGEVRGRDRDELACFTELATMHGADRGAARSNHLPRRGERDLARPVLELEDVVRRLTGRCDLS